MALDEESGTLHREQEKQSELHDEEGRDAGSHPANANEPTPLLERRPSNHNGNHQRSRSQSRSVRSYARRISLFLIPSFLQSRREAESVRSKQLHPTAYLDGMRGVASFLVANCHLAYGPFNIVRGYGYTHPDSGESDTSFWRLPVIRLLYSGSAMVVVFFVVSGYALSYKPLKQIRAHDPALLHTLTSAAFRRGFRLFLPCLASTLIAAILAQLGFYELTRDIATNPTLLTGHREQHVRRQTNIFVQLAQWATQNWLYFQPFIWNSKHEFPKYDEHLWTIPVEFRCSMLLFVTHLGTSHLHPPLRMCFVAALAALSPFKECWPMSLFFGGYLLAELDMRHSSPPTSLPRRAAWISIFLLGLFLMSQPFAPEATYFWATITRLTPPGLSSQQGFLFWPCLGGILFVAATPRVPFLRAAFESRVAQYLGRISYALYLMQSMTIHLVGYACFGFFWRLFGAMEGGSTAAKDAGFAASYVVSVAVLVWAADVFWRGADVPSIRLARWIESKCVARQEAFR